MGGRPMSRANTPTGVSPCANASTVCSTPDRFMRPARWPAGRDTRSARMVSFTPSNFVFGAGELTDAASLSVATISRCAEARLDAAIGHKMVTPTKWRANCAYRWCPSGRTARRRRQREDAGDDRSNLRPRESRLGHHRRVAFRNSRRLSLFRPLRGTRRGPRSHIAFLIDG